MNDNSIEFDKRLKELVRRIKKDLQSDHRIDIYINFYQELIKYLDDYEEETRKVYDEQFFETGDPYTRGLEEGQLIAIRQVRYYIEDISRKELTNEEGKPSNNGTL